jgi:hypothetical protein
MKRVLPDKAAASEATSADFDDAGALSRDFLFRRGRCCEEGCRNCPYGFAARNESPEIASTTP